MAPDRPTAPDAPAPVVIRPHLLVRRGLVAAFVAFTVRAASDLASDGFDARSALVLLFFGAWTTWAAIAAVRERVIVTADHVRVVRILTNDGIARVDVDHIARSGGRGRPAHVALVAGATVPATQLVFDGRPHLGHVETSAVRLPANLFGAQIARALDLPLTTYSGDPVDPDAWRHELDGGYRRPFIWSCLVLLAVATGLTVWSLIYAPGA